MHQWNTYLFRVIHKKTIVTCKVYTIHPFQSLITSSYDSFNTDPAPTGKPTGTGKPGEKTCYPNPCQNSGICIPRPVGYDCKCLSRYTGPLCTGMNIGGALSLALDEII